MAARWLALLAFACASSGPAVTPTGKAPSAKEAAKGARDLLKEAYASLRRGDVDGMQALATPDVLVVGPAADAVFSTRTDAIVALSRAFSPQKRYRVTSRALRVVAAPSGRSAWAVDRVDIEGVPYHLSAMLVESDEFWQIAALHLGRAAPGADQPPVPAALSGGVGAGAEEVAERFKQAARAPERLLDQLAGHDDVGFLGPSTKAVARGQKAFKKTWKKLVAKHLRIAPHETRALLAPDGGLGWVIANADISDDETKALRHRYSLVYERAGAEWRLAVVHASVGDR
jgi:ketosteroid isomerase-like protein